MVCGWRHLKLLPLLLNPLDGPPCSKYSKCQHPPLNCNENITHVVYKSMRCTDDTIVTKTLQVLCMQIRAFGGVQPRQPWQVHEESAAGETWRRQRNAARARARKTRTCPVPPRSLKLLRSAAPPVIVPAHIAATASSSEIRSTSQPAIVLRSQTTGSGHAYSVTTRSGHIFLRDFFCCDAYDAYAF
jgi:hypothetical protein